MMTDHPARPRGGSRRSMRRRSRIAAGVVLAALMSTPAMGTAAARAADTSCPSGLNWVHHSWPEWGLSYWAAEEYVVNSSQPTFLVAEERSVSNNTDTVATATFTSSVSRTYSLTVTVGVSLTLFEKLTTSVSASITTSTTTTTGVSAGASVPAHGRVVGQYGVEAYNVNYSVNTYESYSSTPGENCSRTSSSQGTTVAPTVYTGWRVLPG
ncbi:hypothetical protein [Streptomyces apricus]|uniref:Uncharacterized protein n=1 Tax=Streptomyces apricus TaxID=1828112 RepID=A0A5B0BNL3_9ACTN|nr:hypothetical protein [Streptomyces apricus]KAA0942569.1 hypothetical protein FGF04_02565 [Streptomyces apricus]